MAPHTVFRFTSRCILSFLILVTIFFRIPHIVLWSFSLIVSAFSNAPDPKCDCGPSGCVNGSHEVEHEKHNLYELELEAGDGGDMGLASLVWELQWEGSETRAKDARRSLDDSVNGATNDHDLVAEAAPPSSHALASEPDYHHPHTPVNGFIKPITTPWPPPEHTQGQSTAVTSYNVPFTTIPLFLNLPPDIRGLVFNLAGRPPNGSTNRLMTPLPTFGWPQQKPTPPIFNAVPLPLSPLYHHPLPTTYTRFLELARQEPKGSRYGVTKNLITTPSPPIENTVPPATFPLFSHLPLSVRARIFAFASPPARTRFIELYDYDQFTNTTKVRYYPPLPGLMHACKLAREVCMRLWGGGVVHFLPPDYGYLAEDMDERGEDDSEDSDEGTPFLFGFYANLDIDIIWLSSRFGPRLQRHPPSWGRSRKDPLLSSSGFQGQHRIAATTSTTPIPRNGYTYAPTTESRRLHTLNDLLPTWDLAHITRLALSFSAHERFDTTSDFADAFRWLEACHTVYLLVLDDGYSPRSARYALKVGKPAVGALSGRVRGLLVREEEVWREWEEEVEAPGEVSESESGAEAGAGGSEGGGRCEWVVVVEERRRVRRERRCVEVREVRLDY